MNTLGCDCSTFGNHEFNYELNYMFKVLNGTNFSFTCADLTSGEQAGDVIKDEMLLKS